MQNRFRPPKTFSGIQWKRQLPLKRWGISLSLHGVQSNKAVIYLQHSTYSLTVHSLNLTLQKFDNGCYYSKENRHATYRTHTSGYCDVYDRQQHFLSFLSLRKAYVKESQKFHIVILINVPILPCCCVIRSHLGWKNNWIGFLKFHHVGRFYINLLKAYWLRDAPAV